MLLLMGGVQGGELCPLGRSDKDPWNNVFLDGWVLNWIIWTPKQRTMRYCSHVVLIWSVDAMFSFGLCHFLSWIPSFVISFYAPDCLHLCLIVSTPVLYSSPSLCCWVFVLPFYQPPSFAALSWTSFDCFFFFACKFQLCVRLRIKPLFGSQPLCSKSSECDKDMLGAFHRNSHLWPIASGRDAENRRGHSCLWTSFYWVSGRNIHVIFYCSWRSTISPAVALQQPSDCRRRDVNLSTNTSESSLIFFFFFLPQKS